MRQAAFLKALAEARAEAMREISGNAGAGKVAAGLSNEGWAGGYLQALDDVDAMLRHGYPTDPRRYWKDRTTKDPDHGQ